MILRGNFSSEVLAMSTNVQVFIPERNSAPYRIIYLLHGLHGDQGTWLDNTMLPVYAKEYNAVFVMPEASRSFYLNLKYGRKYFDYVSDELPRVCRKIFNISANREDTAVMGCSMGGYGSLFLSLSKPEQFGFCGAISSACLYFKPFLDSVRADPIGVTKSHPGGEEILVDLLATYGDALGYRPDYDIVELIKKFPADKPKPVIFSTCGTEDGLRKENQAFRDEMKITDFNFAYEEWAGDHDWHFFNEALQKTLEYWYRA
ncbi:MAG: alpha/beta hydrolase-fold protein [Treponema sp.]|nr:alpha/beta hydrolase-fold protein [Treponema sp.]